MPLIPRGPHGFHRYGRQTSYSINLSEGAAYYVWAQAYNNYGDSGYSDTNYYFAIGHSLSVSPGSLSISGGQTGSCTLSGGTGPYSAASANTSVATVSVNGSILTVTGVSAGSSIVTVSDSASGSVTVSVTVSASLSVSPTSLAMTVGETGSCTLSGGTGPYNAVSANTSVATAGVSGSILTVTGVSAGSATVTVYDSAAGSVSVSVVVASIPVALSVNPTSLSISSPGSTGSCTISGGTGPYSASSSNPAVAVTEVSGSTVFIQGVQEGNTTVIVQDSAGHSTGVSVTVSDDSPGSYTNSLGMTFILLPAGTFTMGSPSSELGRDSDEGPQHQVSLTQPFYMQQTEVTQSQWEAVMGSNPSEFSGCPTCPVEWVSWDDVQTYISYMNARGEGTYNLPTEAQWEYAGPGGEHDGFL